MKTLTLITTFLILAISGYCQSYEQFPNSVDLPVWKQTNAYSNYESSIIYGMHGDTIIESETYQKLYVLNDTIFNNEATYYAAIQNKADTVFIIYANKANKCLLFDFSANENDTIWMKSNYVCRDAEISIDYLVVEKIDTIQINGNNHRVFNVTDGFQKDDWIEGLGNNGDIFCPLTQFTDDGFINSSISCFKRNGNIYYPSSESDCFSHTTGLHEKKNDCQFDIYPNPANTMLNINIHNDFTKTKIEIFDDLGRRYKVFKCLNGKMQIPIHDLPKGLFIVNLSNNQQIIATRKIIKQ